MGFEKVALKRDTALAAAAIAFAFLVPVFFAVFAPQRARPAQRAVPVVHVVHVAPPAHLALSARPLKVVLRVPSAFDRESQMSAAALISRWDPDIQRASKRFKVPQGWIRSVMEAESGGRTMLSETEPINSNKGAMGLMQLMPETWREWRASLNLGRDPYEPHDNITAATAYLHALYAKYGYPAMFAAYNDGPGNLEQRMIDGGLLPAETQLYVAKIAGVVPMRVSARSFARFTRPNGEAVMINGFAVTAVRAPIPGEYASGVHAVIAMGRLNQGVRESVAAATRLLRAHGGRV
jgi:soluble lytic murein transglycosylase-like protein